MLNNTNFIDTYITVCYTITFFCITVCLFHSYRIIINNTIVNQLDNTIVNQIDTTRVNEGLPTDMNISPEDFAADPELAEIFGITENNTILNVTLESNERFEQVQNQIETLNRENIMNALNDVNNGDYLLNLYDDLSSIFFYLIQIDHIELILDFLLNLYDFYTILVCYLICYDYIGTIYNIIVTLQSFFN